MTGHDPRLRSRLLIGAIAGLAGTLVMTSAIGRLHRRFPPRERNSPAPREIVDSFAQQAGLALDRNDAADLTTAGHFLYGAAAGALIAAANPRIGRMMGAASGVAVWAVSYLGWIPGVGILKPATIHPRRRHALMLGAHLIWGSATAKAMRELMLARESMMAGGKDEDAGR